MFLLARPTVMLRAFFVLRLIFSVYFSLFFYCSPLFASSCKPHRVFYRCYHHGHQLRAVRSPQLDPASARRCRIKSARHRVDQQSNPRSVRPRPFSVGSALPSDGRNGNGRSPTPPKTPPARHRRSVGTTRSRRQGSRKGGGIASLGATAVFALIVLASTAGLAGCAFLPTVYQRQQQKAAGIAATSSTTPKIISDGGGAKLAVDDGGSTSAAMGSMSRSGLKSASLKNSVSQQQQPVPPAAVPPVATPIASAPTATAPVITATDLQHIVTEAAKLMEDDVSKATVSVTMMGAAAASVGKLTSSVAEVVSAHKFAGGTIINTNSDADRSDTISEKESGGTTGASVAMSMAHP